MRLSTSYVPDAQAVARISGWLSVPSLTTQSPCFTLNRASSLPSGTGPGLVAASDGPGDAAGLSARSFSSQAVVPRPTQISTPRVTTSAMIGVFRFGGADGAGCPHIDPDGYPTGCCGTDDDCPPHDGSGGTAGPWSPQGSAGSPYGSSELPCDHGGPEWGPFCDMGGFLRVRSNAACHRSVRGSGKPARNRRCCRQHDPHRAGPAATVHGRVATPRDLRGRLRRVVLRVSAPGRPPSRRRLRRRASPAMRR